MYSARSAGLGSNLISISDKDIGLTVENPSLLNEDHVRGFQLNQALLPSGVQVGMLCYAFKTKVGIFSPVIRFQNYGAFDGTDELGNSTNKFSAIDYSLGMNYGTAIGGAYAVGAGAYPLKSGFDKQAEARIHMEALEELGQSLENEVAPQVINLDDRTISLSGSVDEQYGQWREILADLYAAEVGQL